MYTPNHVEIPMEAEIRVKIDIDTHKKFVKYCTERHTTRAEVVRQMICQLLQENDKSN